MIPRIDLMKFPARSAEPHQKLFWSNVLVIFNQSKPRELSHCRLLLSICFRCSKLLPSLWNWYFYQRSCFSFFFWIWGAGGKYRDHLGTCNWPNYYRSVLLHFFHYIQSIVFWHRAVSQDSCEGSKGECLFFQSFHGFTNRHRDDVRQGKFKMTEMEVDGGGGGGVRGA